MSKLRKLRALIGAMPLARVGDHGGGADEADDDHGGRRTRLARARAPLRGAVPGPQLPAVATRAPSRTPPRPDARMNDGLVVTVRGLETRLGGRPVLEGIDLEVRRGEVVAIIGPSGGGKTTLLRAMNYLTPFAAGEVEIAGHRLRPGLNERADARALRG